MIKVAVLGLCSVLLTGCSVAQPHAYRYTDIDRFGYVTANAFRVTHPEYTIRRGDYVMPRSAGEMAIQLELEPNWYSTLPKTTLVIRQDKASGRISYSSPDLQGAPALTRALRRVGPPDGDKPAKKAVGERLKEAGRGSAVTVVVELEKPLTAEGIRSRGYLSLNNALFSSAEGGPPIYWDYFETWFCANCGGASDQVTYDFQSWADSLGPEDDASLQQFGLSRDRLVKASQAGRVHGYVVPDANPALLRQLLKKSHVKTMYLVNSQKYCKDSDFSKCKPALWPKNDQLSVGE
ncbi:hypothetical protein AB0F17_58390 [Nonomuraea sp. NPDC026600]|uniref:hypothetical protein n=1 Tax=Nonomuraea sp. NPDC026600 TaxID=3155363 RepID=UPI0033D370B3